MKAREKFEILIAAQRRIERDGLRHEAHPAAQREVSRRGCRAADAHGAGVGFAQGGEQREGGGFARAVGTEQADNFSGVDRYTDAVEDEARTEALAQTNRFKQGRAVGHDCNVARLPRA